MVRTNEARVTVLGLGAMGRALAGAFLAAGHATTVWNRSPGRDDELVARGAVRAPSLRAAIDASPLVIACVLDAAATREIVEPVVDALAGRVLVNYSSDTPERARELATWAGEHHIELLDAAIMVPTAVIGQPEALVLYSGSSQAFGSHRSTLEALGGSPRYLGTDTRMAALYDLALLDLFYSSMIGFVHGLALVGADGVSAAQFMPLAHEFFALLPGMAATIAAAVDQGEHPGTFDNVRMEAAGLAHIVDAAHARGIDTRTVVAAKSIFDDAVAAGHGNESFSSIIEVLRRAGPRTTRG
jgi:3-hydroxyisobutyrate dehydrogenase-like beta-hydroxyacid dehydrogenase